MGGTQGRPGSRHLPHRGADGWLLPDPVMSVIDRDGCHLAVVPTAWCIPVSPQNRGYGKHFHASTTAPLTVSHCSDTCREGSVVTPAIGTCSRGMERYGIRRNCLHAPGSWAPGWPAFTCCRMLWTGEGSRPCR